MSKIINAKVIIFFCILIVSNEDVITNPVFYNQGENPYLFSFDNYYYLYLTGKFTKINKETRESDKENFMYGLYRPPYIWMINQDKEIFLYIYNEAWFSVIDATYTSLSSSNDNLYNGGYMMETEFVQNNKVSQCICDIPRNEIILYRYNADKKINLFFKEQNKEFSLAHDIFSYFEFEEKISCKVLSSGIYVCALCAVQVEIVLIRYFWMGVSNCKADIFAVHEFTELNNYKSVKIFDLFIQNKKMICAINLETNVYECLFLGIPVSVTCGDSECVYSAFFEPTDIKISIELGSIDDVDCELANSVFDNEGLFCCGLSETVKCLRLTKENEEFSIKDTFEINYGGPNSKLFIFSDESNYIDIFYHNCDIYVYGYTIYKPTCTNFVLNTIAYGESNGIVINNIFEEKTDTDYSIKFNNLPNTYGNLLINGEIKDNPYVLNLNINNILKFSSTNDQTVDNFEINYSIAITEGYSAECTITLNILPCWDSCQKCTKSKSESTSEKHNCVVDQCKANYYPSPIDLTNCYTVEEKESNWYLDTETNRFQLCNTYCFTCSGPNIDNCLSCYSASTKPELAYLYNNKCFNECPEGTYSSLQTEGYYKCLPCYDNCETCSEKETYDDSNKLINMNCLKCKKESGTNNENQIFIDSNCFPIKTYTEEKIIFDITVLDTSETEKTCLDYNKAIIHGEYKCITKESNYYYVLNNDENTGVIKKCDVACETCNSGKDELTQNTNCINCNEGYFKTDDSNTNCILENLIPENYYKNNVDNIYYKCYESCSLCNEGEVSNIHNCLKCKDNYYPLKSEERSCYSEETIIEGYFLDKTNKEYKWEDCYEKCASCRIKGNEERMRCLSCKTNYISKEYNRLVHLRLKEGNCIIGCTDNFFLTKDMECVSACPSGTYEYIPNNTCVDECPLNFIVNEEKTK